jgi:Flp pilus assembly protein TadD
MQAIERALALRADWQPGILYRASLLQDQSQEAALDYLRDILQRFPQATDVASALAKELAAMKRFDEARKLFARLSQQEPKILEHMLGEALTAIRGRAYGAAEQALKRALATQPPDPGVLYYYLGIVAEEQWRHAEARDYFRQVSDPAYALQAQTRLARVLAKTGEREAALAIVADLPDEVESDAVLRAQVKAQVWRELKNPEQALLILDEALRRFANQPDLLYDRSLVYESAGRVEDAERDLRQLLQLNPESTTALNALGYTLANRTARFDEAEQLLRRALVKEPENPVVIDSYGWLLFRKGKLDESIDWLGRAYRALSDPEIAAHYGEALWQKGRREEARRIWAEARQLDPGNEVLQEAVQRLTRNP